jgi:DNA repair exonuclease SbcCD ATPase subunit
MENNSDEPLNFLQSLIDDKRMECESRLLERNRAEKTLGVINNEYKELSKQLYILTTKEKDYMNKTEFLKNQFAKKVELNNELREKVIKKSHELKYLLQEHDVIKDKYIISSREEKTFSAANIELEIDVNKNKMKSKLNKNELDEIRKKERFYSHRMKQLTADLASEKALAVELEEQCTSYRKKLESYNSITSQLDSKITNNRSKNKKQMQTIESYKKMEQNGLRKLTLQTKKIKETKEKARQIYISLVEKSKDIKKIRAKQEVRRKELSVEQEAVVELCQKVKIVKSNVQKMTNNEARLDQELERLNNAKEDFGANQKKYVLCLNQQADSAKAKINNCKRLTKELLAEKEHATKMRAEYKKKREMLQEMKEQILNVNNDIILTRKENETTKVSIMEFNDQVKDLSTRYHSKINELKSLENKLHNNLALFENCKKEMATEL